MSAHSPEKSAQTAQDWKKYIEQAKRRYYAIGSVACPAFGGEEVYFNKHGFNHLIRKGKEFRSLGDQRRRIQLFPCVVKILESTPISYYKVNIVDDYPAHFGTFKKEISAVEVTVIVRQLGNKRKHFFSVMDKK